MERMYYIRYCKYNICSFVHEIEYCNVEFALILLIAAGVVTTIQSIKEDWKEGFKGSAIGCVVGLLLNCFAAILYVFNVLSSILNIFSVFTK